MAGNGPKSASQQINKFCFSPHIIRGTFASVRQSKNRSMSHNTLGLLQGTADLLILRALQAGPSHGYAVSRWVRERTEGVLAIEDAALYQALHRLEARGWIDAEWGLSENNRRAKYYRLTAVGRQQVRNEISTWKKYADAVFKVIEPA
jgi:PadR family transcriptional regulator PadR